MTVPYLPPEIITLILRERQPLKRTLATCCLVHKSWLEIARKYLYQSIEVKLFEVRVLRGGTGGGSNEDSDDDDAEWELDGYRLTKRTISLLQSLQKNPHLASLPLSITLTSTEEDDEGSYVGPLWEPLDALNLALSLTPNATALDLDNDPHEFDYLLQESLVERYETMKVAGTNAWFAICRMWNLKHLDIFTLAGFSRSHPPLPHPLETLRCQSTRSMRPSVVGPSIPSACHLFDSFHLTYPTLRALDIPWTSLPELDSQRLTKLEHLKLHSWHRNTVPALKHSNGRLSLFRKLTTLTFSGEQHPNLDTILKSWPDRLPPSLLRINLEHTPSLDVLLSIVSNAFSTSGPTKQLSIRLRPSDAVKNTQYLVIVRFMCENAGIELFLSET